MINLKLQPAAGSQTTGRLAPSDDWSHLQQSLPFWTSCTNESPLSCVTHGIMQQCCKCHRILSKKGALLCALTLGIDSFRVEPVAAGRMQCDEFSYYVVAGTPEVTLLAVQMPTCCALITDELQQVCLPDIGCTVDVHSGKALLSNYACFDTTLRACIKVASSVMHALVTAKRPHAVISIYNMQHVVVPAIVSQESLVTIILVGSDAQVLTPSAKLVL